MNFEHVNKHIDAVDLKAIKAHDKATAMANLCPTYKAIKPILAMVEKIPFIPAKWKTVIKQFCALLDLICP